MALHRTLPVLEIRSAPQGLVEGYASVFDGIDVYGDSIARGAYQASLDNHKAAGTRPVMLWSHEPGSPIGRWEQIKEDGRGLRVEGQLNLKTQAGREAFEHLRAGDVAGFSIGYNVAKGGFEMRGDVRVLKKVNLHEISVVTLPADPQARITAVKGFEGRPENVREMEHALQALGFTRREASVIATKGFRALEGGAAQADERVAEQIKAFSQFLKQRNDFGRIF
jgi:HK97 family phage prohead protease